ncbi:MAG: LysM peptidoglycan-binding domain-containing protein [Gammaproteobacteria bacterium]
MNWNHILQALVVGALSIGSLCSVAASAEIATRADTVVDKTQTSMWDHLRADFNIDHQSNLSGVATQRKWYLSHTKHIKTILQRSAPYIYFINEELEKRNLPAELALIPIIESAYNPAARSPSNAAGLWQMIPGTGRNFGLVQNSTYDGRHDIYASTQAALNYLTGLSKKFNGDWTLAIAAYNAGEGTVQRAINRNRAEGKPTDIWSLRIPTHTRMYVQRFLALADIITHAEQYNITLPAIPNRPAIILVKLKQQTDLNRAAQMAGISLQELYSLNPGFINRKAAATPPNGPHHLLLPVSHAKAFTQQSASFQPAPAKTPVMPTTLQSVNNVLYKVQKGDTLNKIAKQHNVTASQLKQENKLNSSTIKVGQELTIPGKLTKVSANSAVVNVSSDTSQRINYRIKQGDSLSKIANVFSTTIQQLLAWNNQISTKSVLRPGDLLTIYVKN